MGGVGKFIGSLFGVRQQQYSTSGVTARDLVPSTTSKEPEAPVFGSDDLFDGTQNIGKDALKISLDTASKTKKGVF